MLVRVSIGWISQETHPIFHVYIYIYIYLYMFNFYVYAYMYIIFIYVFSCMYVYIYITKTNQHNLQHARPAASAAMGAGASGILSDAHRRADGLTLHGWERQQKRPFQSAQNAPGPWKPGEVPLSFWVKNTSFVKQLPVWRQSDTRVRLVVMVKGAVFGRAVTSCD